MSKYFLLAVALIAGAPALNAPPSTLPISVIAQTFNYGAAASAAGGTDPAIAVSVSAGGDVGRDEAQAQAVPSVSISCPR